MNEDNIINNSIDQSTITTKNDGIGTQKHTHKRTVVVKNLDLVVSSCNFGPITNIVFLFVNKFFFCIWLFCYSDLSNR